MRWRQILIYAKRRMFSPKGRDILVFCAFLLMSALLWLGKAMSENTQRDVRCDIEISEIPDSVMRVSNIPEAVNVSLSGSGMQMFIKELWHRPVIRVDYRKYMRNGAITLGGAEMRSLARQTLGQNINVLAINPDTLQVKFTSRPPVHLPVRVDARITTLPNCALTGEPTASIDSVWVYSVDPLPAGMTVVRTQPVRLADVSKSQTVRVPLATPADVRAVPDSIEVHIDVEPMISRTVTVPIHAINVPAGIRMILMPATVRVSYTMPMSRYNKQRPRMLVNADYRSLDANYSDNRIAIKLITAQSGFNNIYLETDSVEYIIEKQ